MIIKSGAGHCNLGIVKIECDFIVLVDNNAFDSLSITNSAEEVTKAVHAIYPDKRIYYYDTDNNYDELMHEDGVFTGFRPGGDP